MDHLSEVQRRITPFTEQTSRNLGRRLNSWQSDIGADELERLRRLVDQLNAVKETLVEKRSAHATIAYGVPGGLGAVCITCVETYVTPSLIANRFAPDVIVRQFPYEFWGKERSAPGIHAYNIIRLGRHKVVIDMDLDPFLGHNAGITIYPLHLAVPLYRSGFVYHARRYDSDGKIAAFLFAFLGEDARPVTFAKGSIADSISVAPYHCGSGKNACPLCVAGRAMVYFAFERCYQGAKAFNLIPFSLVCPVAADDRERAHQIDVYGATRFYIRGMGERKQAGGAPQACIRVLIAGGRVCEFLVDSDGVLLESACVTFGTSAYWPNPTHRVSLGTGQSSEPRVVLPRVKADWAPFW